MDFIKLQGIFEEGYGIIGKKVMKDKNLNVISKAIYAYICSYSGKGSSAFPSQKLICSDLDISKDTLSKYVAQLKEFGYITVKQEKENGKFARNVYTINIVPCMVSSDTVKTVSDFFGYGEVDTNNNSSFNNNNNINNKKIDRFSDNAIKKESINQDRVKFKDDFLRYIDLVSKATDTEIERVRMTITPSTFSSVDIDKVLEEINNSKFLKGELDTKPSITNFSRINMIKKILVGEYRDKEKVIKTTKPKLKEFTKQEEVTYESEF